MHFSFAIQGNLIMKHILPPLPWAQDALEPVLSRETVEYHYGKHHQAYINKLNDLIPGTEYENLSLEDIIKKSSGSLFNNAAQVWNHTFYWHCLAPAAKSTAPKGKFAEALQKTFGSLEEFRKHFSQTAVNTFGSGWAWLIKNATGTLEIISTSNAGTPMTEGKQALLTCDVWEHAYYIDYRNARPTYIEKFWDLINWEFVEKNFVGAEKTEKVL
jgi:superoxide dismutase, Fe-Mn family